MLYLSSDNSNEAVNLKFLIMILSNMNTQQLVKEALSMVKYQNDIDGVIIINNILEELKWKMSATSFEEFKKTLSLA